MLITAAVLAATSTSLRLRAQAGLETLPVQGSVYALVSSAGNSTVQIGPEGPLVVDTLPATSSEQLLAAVRALSPRPIRHIVLTSGDPLNAGGAASLSKAGRYVRVIDSIDPRGGDTRASIIAHLNVLNRMTAGGEASGGWPTDTYLTPDWSLFSNGEAVQFFHVPAAHTDGDTIVFFRRSDVVSTGAVFDAEAYPRFDKASGGSIDGMIQALNRVIDIAIPGENQEGGTVIVPGHGRLSDETDVANYRDMVTIVRDRVRAMVKRGRPSTRSGAPVPPPTTTASTPRARGRPTSSSKRCSTASAGRGDDAAVHWNDARDGCGARRSAWRRRRDTRVRSAGAAAARDGASGGPSGSHRSMGVGHHRRLAVADGHAAERRHVERAAQPGRTQGGRRVGSGGRPRPRRSCARRSGRRRSSASRHGCASGGRTTIRCCSSSTPARRPDGCTSRRRRPRRDRCRGSRRRSGSASRRIAASSAAAGGPPAARSRS